MQAEAEAAAGLYPSSGSSISAGGPAGAAKPRLPLSRPPARLSRHRQTSTTPTLLVRASYLAVRLAASVGAAEAEAARLRPLLLVYAPLSRPCRAVYRRRTRTSRIARVTHHNRLIGHPAPLRPRLLRRTARWVPTRRSRGTCPARCGGASLARAAGARGRLDRPFCLPREEAALSTARSRQASIVTGRVAMSWARRPGSARA